MPKKAEGFSDGMSLSLTVACFLAESASAVRRRRLPPELLPPLCLAGEVSSLSRGLGSHPLIACDCSPQLATALCGYPWL